MKKLVAFPFKRNEFKSADLIVGNREAIRGNVNANTMLDNLKKYYHKPYGIDEEKICDSIKTYQNTLRSE